jgi:hypothetical protein
VELKNVFHFDIPQPVYLDENAPSIEAVNIPAKDDNHRDVMVAWVRQEMTR